MIILEQLYRLLAADDQTRPLDPVFEAPATAGAAVNVQAAFQCPERHAFLLTHALALYTPGAGQNVDLLTQIRIAPGDATRLVRLEMLPVAAAANVRVVQSWQGEALLQPGGQIVAEGRFNAGAVANNTVLYVHGMLIPLGTIQRT